MGAVAGGGQLCLLPLLPLEPWLTSSLPLVSFLVVGGFLNISEPHFDPGG